MKPQIQIDIEKRKLTHTCSHCGKDNVNPEDKFKFYKTECKYCGKAICVSYIFAPWNYTWDEVQILIDKTKAKMDNCKAKAKARAELLKVTSK